jgi:hypothetical protein
MVEPDRTILIVSIIGLVVIWGSVAYHRFVQDGAPASVASSEEAAAATEPPAVAEEAQSSSPQSGGAQSRRKKGKKR